jgi:hypothetical protein
MIGPMYHQVVAFNPLSPKKVIGALAKNWEVRDDGKAWRPG